jgi:glycerol-3-phosphate acyltransferase PlsX
LRPLLANSGLEQDNSLQVLHASEVVAMDDKPLQALKRKKDSSMVRAIELCAPARPESS